MRATAFAVLFISFTAAAQTGASVCGTIYASDEKVRCLQGIAGHTVEPAAAAVCGTIYAGNEKAACLKQALPARRAGGLQEHLRGQRQGELHQGRGGAAAGAGGRAPPLPPGR